MVAMVKVADMITDTMAMVVVVITTAMTIALDVVLDTILTKDHRAGPKHNQLEVH